MIETDKIKIIATNRKANFQYEIISKFEAGIILKGTEVKSVRESKVNLQESYAKIINNEIWLINAHINEYKFGNINNHDPVRNRKLLFNKHEIKKIKGFLEEKGLTLIPLKIYLKGSLIKIEMAIAKGKKLYDKRETIKKRDIDRKLNRI
jgi:SsrA-binding protein